MRALFFIVVFTAFSVSSYSADVSQNYYIIPFSFNSQYRTPQNQIGDHVFGGVVPSEKTAFFEAKANGHEPWTKLHPLMQAILINPSEIGSIVKETKVDLNQPVNGRFPLRFATEVAESPKAVEELLKAGANVNLKVQFFHSVASPQETVLDLMVQKVHPHDVSQGTNSFSERQAIIKILIRYGADLSVRDWHGRTPYMWVLDIYSKSEATLNGRPYNTLPKELMSWLRKGKTPFEITHEFDMLIKQAKSKYIRSRLEQFMEQEFSILIAEAKSAQERQHIKNVLKNSQNRPNLLSRAINKCFSAFL